MRGQEASRRIPTRAKRLDEELRCDRLRKFAHGFVNGIILLPDFGQAGVKLECEMRDCCLRARSAFEHRIPQPPSPPGFETDRALSFSQSVRVAFLYA